MRWLVFFLLILNGLVFVWFNFQRQYNNNDAAATTDAVAFNFAAAPSLQLLEELPSGELQSRDTRRPVKPMTVPVVNAAAIDSADNGEVVAAEPVRYTCQIIGSYPEIISARQVRLMLADSNIESRVVQIARQLPAVSWVYIPPLADRKEALAVLKSLQDKKIDSFLMSEEGEYQHAISLGFFSNPESAKNIVSERRAQGYNAQLTMRVRERKAYWVALEKPESVMRASDAVLASVLSDRRDVKKQEISCAEVALLETIN